MSTAAQLGYLGLEGSDPGAWRRFATTKIKSEGASLLRCSLTG